MARTSEVAYNVFCDKDQDCRFARIGNEDLIDRGIAIDMGQAHMSKNPGHQVWLEKVSRQSWKLSGK